MCEAPGGVVGKAAHSRWMDLGSKPVQHHYQRSSPKGRGYPLSNGDTVGGTVVLREMRDGLPPLSRLQGVQVNPFWLRGYGGPRLVEVSNGSGAVAPPIVPLENATLSGFEPVTSHARVPLSEPWNRGRQGTPQGEHAGQYDEYEYEYE